MIQDSFFDNFAFLADAPNGVQKLRELILQLAVQGKLVAQDPEDEPVAELLKRIQKHKAELAKSDGTGRSSAIRALTDDDGPFTIPCGWVWVRLGSIIISRDGERIPVSKEERAGRAKIYDYYGASGVIDKIDDYLFDKPLLLIGEDGANLINRSTPIAFIARGKYWVNNHAHALDGISEGFLRYIELYINAIDLKPYVTGTAQPKMNQAKMNSIPVALPPLAEQHRIVAKVDQLMALCDELEAKQQQQRSEARDRLSNTLIDKLLTACDPAEFDEHWQRICEHFDLLYDTPDTIGKLRQAILQLAVQGKLVPHDPKDEPASILLEEIKTEKEKLTREGKIGRFKPLQQIKTDEIPFSVPSGWKWSHLDDVAIAIHYGFTASANHTLSAIRLLRITDIQNNKVIWENVPGCEIDRKSAESYALKDGDLLIARTGGTIGKSYLVQDLSVCAVFASYLIRVVPSQLFLPAYLKCFADSPLYWTQLYAKSMGTGQPNVNGNSLKSLLVPVPPKEEQHRIVAKVDQLMALCDELEAKLKQAQAGSEKLATAMVQSLLA